LRQESEGRRQGTGGERKKGWGAEELRNKRELIIFEYLARKSHPKFRSPGDRRQEAVPMKKNFFTTMHENPSRPVSVSPRPRVPVSIFRLGD